MEFEKKVPVWNAEGAEPPESLKNSGFQGGYKPPAPYFNWFWHSVSACLAEIQAKMGDSANTKPARFVVGTSVSGWSSAGCDYLCDGTDDEAEINAAIAALPTAGGEVVLLDGAYTISGAIKINKANVTLRGNGSATKLVRNFGGGSVHPAAVFVSGANCVVRDIAIDGVKETYTTRSYAIGIKSTGDNNTIDGCNIYNHAGNAIYIVAGHNVVSRNITKANYTGIALEGHNNIVNGNNITGGEKYGISLKSANHNTIICNVCRMNNDSNIQLSAASGNIFSGNNCTVLDEDDVRPSISIFISNSDCEGNIAFDNLLGTGKLTDRGTNNDVGTAVPNTRKINGKALSGDITLTASDVGATPGGYGLGSALPAKTVTNCNDAVQTGWYKVAENASNAPVATEFLLRCEMSSVYSGVQTAYIDPGNNMVKMRGRTDGGNWSDWVDVNVGTVPVERGGTGAANAKEARTNLGAAAKFFASAIIGTTWSGSGPFTQTVSVPGMLASDAPIIDMLPSTDLTTAEAELEAWGMIYRIDTAADSITVYAREATTQAITIQILGVR